MLQDVNPLPRLSSRGCIGGMIRRMNAAELCFANATLVLPDRLVERGMLQVRGGRIIAAGPADAAPPWSGPTLDVQGLYLSPGFIDMHVHGGAGADFMDGTPDAFEAVIRAHAAHGTTSIVPTSTVARHDQTIRFLELCRQTSRRPPRAGDGLGRVIGAHLYGPYFAEEKVGCHPRHTRPPTRAEYEQYLQFNDVLLTATCAPELPGAEGFYRAAAEAGVRLNAGHSNASWSEMQRAHELGVRHVDHLYCAMSSVVSLRSRLGTPMQASMLEFVLANDDMTTELIADGRHLAPDLLAFVLKMLGPGRTALVTDCSRALDMPPGEYLFGPKDGGEPFYSDGAVGLTTDRSGLASSIRGMAFMVRHMHKVVGIDLATAVRMASLTPARILGLDQEIGSLEPGKRADFLLLGPDLDVRSVYVEGTAVI